METTLGRQQASDAVSGLGWRYLLGALRTSVLTESLAQAAELASILVSACGDAAERHLRIDLRSEQLALTVQSLELGALTADDVRLAHRISAAVRAAGLRTEPGTGEGAGSGRSVQTLELAVDALDIAAVRPFWKAVLGYADEPGHHGPEDPLVDPVGQGPSVWFQQMDRPRPQRNRIHVDVCVPHDEAAHRIGSAVAAGGRLVSDAEAPAFWLLADAEGNEACVTTWQGRDPQG